MNTFYTFCIVLSSIGLGAILCLLSVIILDKQIFKKSIETSESIVEKAKNEIEILKNDQLELAKKKIAEVNASQEKSYQAKISILQSKEEELKELKSSIDERSEAIKKKYEIISKTKDDLDFLRKEKIKKLEQVANLSADEAKKELLVEIESEIKFSASILHRRAADEASSKAAQEAKRLIASAMQRIAAEQTIENSSISITLEDNTQKGIIIGKDGRNIKSLEFVTGVDVVIDETPNTIVLSCHDPIKRHIAKLAVQNLLNDGRVHPARIEEVVQKVETSMEKEIYNIGEQAILALGIYGLHEDMIRLVGKMNFRTSYGQNLLLHSKEVANLCAVMAAELGLDVKKCKRAGFLHDIGKVSKDDPELSHAILGMKLCEKYGESPEVCNAVGAHHDEIEMTNIISPIVQTCDAISGAKPGARKDVSQQYLKRLKDLESLAFSYQGVKQAYAIQAGRELRVMVDSECVSDNQSQELVYDLARKIEKELQYPGHIKIVVLREKRNVEIAR